MSGMTVSMKFFLTSLVTATAVCFAVLAWLGVISSDPSISDSGAVLVTLNLMFCMKIRVGLVR